MKIIRRYLSAEITTSTALVFAIYLALTRAVPTIRVEA